MRLVSMLMITGVFMTPVSAHQLKSAITTVLFNANSQNLEVMHRFYLHDAEHAAALISEGNADIISDEATQNQFVDYVIERFKLMKNDNKVLPLKKVGFEIDGKFLWVYQETPIPNHVESLKVKHNALQDIWPDQVNTVNIEGTVNGEKSLQTLTFRESSKLLEVSF